MIAITGWQIVAVAFLLFFAATCALTAVRLSNKTKEVTLTHLKYINDKLLGQLEKMKDIERLTYGSTITRLYSTDYMDASIEFMMEEAADGANVSMAAIMIDIDKFFKINEIFGETSRFFEDNGVGTLSLQEFANRIRSVTREEDICCHLFSDNFAILMPNSTITQAEEVAKRLVHSIHNKPFIQSEVPSPYNPSLSIGITEYGPEDDSDTMVKRMWAAVKHAMQVERPTEHSHITIIPYEKPVRPQRRRSDMKSINREEANLSLLEGENETVH